MISPMKAPAMRPLFCFLSILLAAAALSATEPTPKVLTQAKLDRFLADMDKVTGDSAVATAWEGAYQAASMEAVMDPNSNLGTLDPLSAAYAIMDGARSKVKKDATSNAALGRLGWTSEFWDIYVVMAMGIHLAAVIDFNKGIAAEGMRSEAPDASLPPFERFMHKDDFALIQANYQRIFGLVGDEISRNNGF
jgi:hypothetical protein